MKKYQNTILVKPQHLDDLNHVNNVVYLQWVQDIAGEHWFSAAGKEREVLWVVRKHEIEYFNAAQLGEELVLSTWVESMRGLISKRLVEIHRGEELICRCTSDWVMLDANSKRPKRIPAEIASLF